MLRFVWMERFIVVHGVMILSSIFAVAGIAWMFVNYFKYDSNPFLLLVTHELLHNSERIRQGTPLFRRDYGR